MYTAKEYIDKIERQRDGLLAWVMEQEEDPTVLAEVLKGCGFTLDEIAEELECCGFEEEDISDIVKRLEAGDFKA